LPTKDDKIEAKVVHEQLSPSADTFALQLQHHNTFALQLQHHNTYLIPFFHLTKPIQEL
jgi:hypothetical protein